MTVTVTQAKFDPAGLVGLEVLPGLKILDPPTWHKEANEWRALVAGCGGPLLLVALKFTIVGND